MPSKYSILIDKDIKPSVKICVLKCQKWRELPGVLSQAAAKHCKNGVILQRITYGTKDDKGKT